VRVDIGGARLFVEILGPEWVLEGEELRRRPTLVALHGGPGVDGTKLRHQAAHLADVAQIVVPDQRGHGRSDRGAPEDWNLARWAADVVALCEVLEIDRPVVMGTSFGGFVAQKYASEYPDHPGGLVLVSCGARYPARDEAVERARAIGGSEAAEAMRRDIEEVSEESAAEWSRVLGPLMSLKAGSDPDYERLEALRIRTMEVNFHHHRGEARGMDLQPGLRRVRCPTLVLVGKHDPIVPVEMGQEIVDAIPEGLARLVSVPNAAHELFVDNPDVVYGEIRAFVRRLAPEKRTEPET
jgi:pimeloyl-ACP methyl ester carboxylesterase